MKLTTVFQTTQTDNLVAMLCRLSAACELDAKRFERAAREVTNEELSLLFCRYARRRAEFAREINLHIDRLEGKCCKAEPDNNNAPRLSRRVSLKPGRGRRDDGTILLDIEQAENRLCELYEEALAMSLPGDLPMCLRRQHLAVCDVYSQMRDLCAALAWCAVPMAV